MKKMFLFAVMVVVSLSAHCQIEELQKRANKGDAEAQCKLGRMYDDLDTAMHDYAKAHLWYTKAANQGNAEAQFRVGYLYLKGRGVEKNYAEAMKWYKLSAAQNNKNGLRGMGNI